MRRRPIIYLSLGAALVLLAVLFFVIRAEELIQNVELIRVYQGHQIARDRSWGELVTTRFVELVQSGREVMVTCDIFPTTSSARDLMGSHLSNPNRTGTPSRQLGEASVLFRAQHGPELIFSRHNLVISLGKSSVAKHAESEAADIHDLEIVGQILDEAIIARHDSVRFRPVSLGEHCLVTLQLKWHRFLQSLD